jgi:hypothetical protein
MQRNPRWHVEVSTGSGKRAAGGSAGNSSARTGANLLFQSWAADGLVDADGLTCMIVNAIDLRKPEQDGHPNADLVLHLRATATSGSRV